MKNIIQINYMQQIVPESDTD